MVVLAAVIGISAAIWRGSGPLPDPVGCQATVDGLEVPLALDQSRNATLIAAIAIRRGLPARAVSIALATAYQESKIRNLNYGDRDSLGIFQQRPSQGWGTVEQIRNEFYSINAFYNGLIKVEGYETMRITEAAQEVQRSGFPEAYEDHAEDGRALASAMTGYSPAAFTCVARTPTKVGSADRTLASLANAFGSLDAARTGIRQDIAVTVGSGERATRLGWAVASYLVARADTLRIRSITVDGRTWSTGRDSEQGWRTATGRSEPGVVAVDLG